MEAHGVRTAWGDVSFALRWHGSRPALLWEVVPRGLNGEAAGSAPVVTAPALDPGFRGTQWSGEALLEPPRAHGEAVPDGPGEGQSFS